MVKKFFSVALLLTVFAVAQAVETPATSSVTSSAAATTSVAASKPAESAKPAEVTTTTPATPATPAATEVKPAAVDTTKAVEAKKDCSDNFVCKWGKLIWEKTYVSHPSITLAVAGIATAGLLYSSSDTVKSLFGQGSADSEKCPCSKPPRN